MEYIDFFSNIIIDKDITYDIKDKVINYIINSFVNDDLYDLKQKVINYVMYCFEKELHRIKKKEIKIYFIDIENKLDLFNRKFKNLNNKEYKKWINKFLEIILILEDDFYKFVDINENIDFLEKMKTYYNNFYRKQYKIKNLHNIKCPIKIYNNFAYAVVYNEYYLKIIRKIKLYNKYNL